MGRPMKNRSFSSRDDVAVAYEISGTSRVDSDRALFARNTMIRLQAEGRAAPVWIAAAVIAMTWAPQPQASLDRRRYAAADEQRAMKARMEARYIRSAGLLARRIGSAFKAWKGIG